MSSRYDDKKVVSIEFDNKQFERDVSHTLDTIQELDEATSGKRLKGDGISTLEKAFSIFSRNATSDIEQVNRKLSDTSAYEGLAKSLDNINEKVSDGSSYNKMAENIGMVTSEFSGLEMAAMGALFSIGELAIRVGLQIADSLTKGIRDGWSEYNLLMDSTQVILANTKKYGTTIQDVTAALDELNDYADKTVYNFAQMTSNLGRFTAAGVNLEDSVTLIKGMSNLGALFGTDNAAMQRATWQMSQAVASGKILLRDWMSMEAAQMNGAIIQEELMNTAATMQGMSIEEFKSMINYTGTIRDTLNTGWLTAEVYLETMRKFSGESREYWESLEDASGNRLYSDEEIDRIMEQGQAAYEAATKVRTLTQMIDALKEAIGSGWGESFRLIIGDLEQAKTFWTPINDILTGLIGGVSKFRNDSIRAWAQVYRSMAVEDIEKFLKTFGNALEAIGRGFVRVFGNSATIGHKIGQLTEALGDLIDTFVLTDEELEDITDLVEGLLAPFKLLGDIIFGLAETFFDARDAMNEFDTRGESLIDKTKELRKGFFDLLGKFGRFIKGLKDLADQYGIVTGIVNICKNAFLAIHNVLVSFFNWLGPVLSNLWNNYLVPFLNIFGELAGSVFQWLRDLKTELDSIDVHILEDLKNIFEGLYNIFIALIDPTKSVTESMSNFRDIVANTSIHEIINKIKDSLNNLWESLKNTRLFNFFIEALERFKNTQIGSTVTDLIEKLRNFVSIVFGNFQGLNMNGGFLATLETFIDNYIIPLKDKIASLNVAENAIGMMKNVFHAIFDFVASIVTAVIDRFGGLSFETDTEVIVSRIIKMLETLLMFATIFAAVSVSKTFTKKVDGVVKNIIKPLNTLSNAVEQRMKKDTWEVIGEFIKNLSIFVIALTASVYLLASIKDPYIAFPLLVAMLGGIAIILVAITTSINSMFTTLKTSGLISNISSMLSIKSVLNSVSTILIELYAFIASVAVFAYLYSRLDSEEKSTIAIAFAALIGTFLLVSSMLLIIMDKMTAEATVLAGMGKQLAVVKGLYSSIMGSLTSIVIMFSLAAALMMKTSGGDYSVILAASLSLIAALSVMVLLSQSMLKAANTLQGLSNRKVNAISKFIKSLGTVLLLISASISILAHFGGGTANIVAAAISLMISLSVFTMISEELLRFSATVGIIKGGQIAKIESFMVILSLIGLILSKTVIMVSKENQEEVIGAAILVLGIIAAFSIIAAKFAEFTASLANIQFKNILKVASSIYLLLGALFIILSAMDKLGSMVKDLGMETVIDTIGIIAGLLLGLLGIVAVMSVLQQNFAINTGALLGAAASILIISIALIPITQGIATIASMSSIDSMGAIRAAESISMVLLAIAVSLGGITSVWNAFAVNAGIIVLATASILVISASLILIAEAIKKVASVGDIWDATKAILVIIGVITLILTAFTAISVLTEGIGAAVILAVAAGFLMMAVGLMAIGAAVQYVGAGMKMAGEGVKIFAEGMEILEALDPERLTSSLRAVADFFPMMAKSITTAKPYIVEAIKIVFEGIAKGLIAGVKTIFDVIANVVAQGFTEHFRIISTLLIEAFGLLLDTFHGFLEVMADFLSKELGPDGPLRKIATAIGSFILWLATKIGGFIFSMVTKIADSIADAVQNDNIIARLVNAIQHLILSVKLALYSWLGVSSLGEWFAQMAIGAVGAWIDATLSGMSSFTDLINDAAEDLTGERIDLLDDFSNRLTNLQSNINGQFGTMMNNYQSGAISEIEAQLATLGAEADALDATLSAEEERQRRIEAEGDTSVYNPSRYYAAAAGVENWNNQLSQTPSLLNTISSFFGGGNGQGLGDIIAQFFGGDGSSLGSFGDFGSMFNNLGGDAGSSWGDGFSNAITGDNNPLESISTTDFSNLDNLSNIDYNGFNNILENIGNLPDDVTNPVITPVVDDTEYNLGLDRMEKTWNSHNFDEFAIDADKSMLLRERAEGDATTDGSVSYNYTQIINNATERSPIEVYRDTQSLLRGRIN